MLQQWDEWLRKNSRPIVWALFLTTVIVLLPSLDNEFVFTDVPQVLQNPFVTNLHLGPRVFVSRPAWNFPAYGEASHAYQPLRSFLFWLLYQAAGPNPALFHLMGLLMYASAASLLLLVGRDLLQNHLAALAAALLWAVHPVNVATAAWTSALADVGAALSCLLAFYLFLHAEKGSGHAFLRHVLAALAYFPALWFKESALLFPLLLLGYWLILGGDEGWRRRAARWLPYLAASALYISARAMLVGQVSDLLFFWRPSAHLIAAAAGLLGHYLRHFLWPLGPSPFRVFNLAHSLGSPWPWAALLLIAAAWWGRRRQPVPSFLVLAWGLTLLPSLDVLRASPPGADQAAFLPSAALCLAVGYLALVWLPQRFPLLQRDPVVVLVLAFAAFLWAVQSFRVLTSWGSNDSLLAYSSPLHADSPSLHVFHGAILQSRDKAPDRAVAEYETALLLNRQAFLPRPSIAYECYLSLGQIALAQGRPEEAIQNFEKAAQIAPFECPAHKMLGTTYFAARDYRKALDRFRQAVGANPMDAEARFFLGTCWLNLGAPRSAAEQFHLARVIDRDFIPAFEAEARALEALGDRPGAARVRGQERATSAAQ